MGLVNNKKTKIHNMGKKGGATANNELGIFCG